jgi:hypothetical protein
MRASAIWNSQLDALVLASRHYGQHRREKLPANPANATAKVERYALGALRRSHRRVSHVITYRAKSDGSVMTNHEAWKLYEKYLSAWNTTSIEQRLKIANEVLSENIEYQTARHDLCTGRAQVIEDKATFHERFPEAILK